MMKFRLKFISVLLALVMFLTFVPDTLYAEAADLLSDMMSNESLENVKAENSEETENTSKEVYALGEDTSKRTENAKYIRMSDGSYYVAMYDNAVHYQDENGVWQDIDNTLADSLAADSDDVAGVATSKGKHTVKFANNSNSSKLVAIRQDKYKISFNLVGANKSKAATVTNPTEHAEDATELEKITVLNKMISSVKYADILDGVDLEYVVSGNDVKENIIVKECADKYIYQFDMKLNKLVAEIQENGKIALKDDKSGEVVYTIDSPYMFDAKGERSTAVTYVLEGIKNNEYRITVTADAEWINTESRAFPVTIDPPINASSDVQNTYVSEDEFDRNLTGYNLYDVGYADGYRLYTFWKSDFLPQIPQGSVIQKATLSFRQGSYYSDAAESYVGLYQVSGDWSENNITWENMPNTEPVRLDYSAVSSSSNNTVTTWDITKAAKEWYYSGSNYGIAVKPLYDDDTVDDFEVGFFSRYVTSYAPTFTVTYRSIVGIEDYYTYHTQSIGRAGIGYLNDYTSNLTLAHSDLSSNSETISFSLSHVYNDVYAGDHFTSSSGINTCDFFAMSMGYGWKLNVQETIIQKVIGGETFYIYNDGDGTEHYFSSIGGKYIDEDGLGLTLTISGTTYTIKDKQDNKKIFSNGKLTQIVDSDGNKILINYVGSELKSISRQNIGKNPETIATLSYAANKLDTITDAYGRVTEFDYDSNNCLIRITYPDEKTSEYTYNANNNYRLTSATDKEANYGVSYTMSYVYTQQNYAWKYVRDIREYYLSGTTPNYGQGVYVENIIGKQATYTPYKSGTTLEDISTTYSFDNHGRTLTAYSSDIDGNIYGASSADYVDSDNVKQNNRIDTSAVVGAISQNCILNGGFENGTSATGWRTYNLSVGNSVTYAHTGTKALISSSTSNLTRYAYQTFKAKNAGQYTASAYVNVSETDFSYGGYIYVKVTDTYGNTVEGTKITNNMTDALDDPWQRIYVTFDAVKDRDYTVYIYMTGISGGIAYIDDVQVERNAGPSTVNLLEGVETWTFRNGAIQFPLEITATNTKDAICLSTAGAFGVNANASKTVPIKKSGNTTFIVSAWAELKTTPSASYREISLTAKVVYSDGTTEPFVMQFTPELYGIQQFMQMAIVPTYTSKTINEIQLTLAYENHLGSAYIYDLALVEGVVNDYEYNAEGNVTSSKQSNVDKVETRYDSNNNVIEQKQGNSVYTYTYGDSENVHRVTGVTTPNTFMDFEYDDYGNVVGMTISGGNPISYYSQNTYTSDGNYLASQTDMNRITTSYGYDDYDLISKITNGKGVETTYTYDVNNDRQLSAAVNSLIRVNYAYTNAALSQITRNDGQTYSFTYNSFGRTTAVKVGSITLVTYTYEAYNGNLLTTTYNNGVVISNEYDELDRIIAIKINGVTKYKYSYNGNGNLSELRDIDNNITICYNYDINNRLISVWQTDGGDIAYTYYKYDGKNRVSEYNCVMQTWGPEFSHNYTYTYGSQDDKLEEIYVNDNDSITYTYDSVDRLASKSVSATGINLQQLYYYNDGEYMTNQISDLYVKLNNVTSKMFGYTYDAIGNITQITVGNSTESAYEYDAQGQLKSETIASQNLKYVYTYDNYGNIQTVTKKNLSTDAEIDTYNYTYGNSQWKDRLTAFEGKTFVYDNIGNPTTYYNGGTDADEYTFTWQKGRELASAQKNGVTTTYTYGADGLRIAKSSGYEFFYSDGRLVRQLWADGEVLDFLYDESGTPYAMQYYDTMYYYVKNLQGDVVAIADANGTIVVNYAYDAWGNILSITDGSGNDISNNTWHIGNLNPIRYRSYYYDTETGFYYLQTRYYDPAIRRFINADGYINANGDILGFNMYAYCGNNPVNYVDYGGNEPTTILLALYQAVVASILLIVLYSIVTSPGFQDAWTDLGTGISNVCTEILDAASVAVEYVTDAVKEHTDTSKTEEVRGHCIYTLTDSDGKVVYVGRTVNPDARAAVHALNPYRDNTTMTVVASGLSYREARIAEQAMMAYHHTLNTQNKTNNQINGVSPAKWDIYDQYARSALEYGWNQITNELLAWIGS